MSPWLFIGVSLVVLGHVIARRIEAKAVAPIVAAIRRLRVAAKTPPRRAPAAPDHPRLQAQAQYYQSASRALAERGFILTGDLLEYRADGSELGVSRWFAAEDGSISGWFAVLPAASTPVMMFVSQLAPPKFVVTFFGGPTTMLAIPPTVQRTFIEHSSGLDAAVAAHQQAVRAAGGMIARAVRSQEDAVATVDSLRAHVSAWRSQQRPEGLVDLDLRSVFPEQFHKFAPVVKRVMRADK